MNARTHSLTERAVTDSFVFASLADEHVRWLAETLIAAGRVEAVTLDPATLTQRIAVLNPSLVFVDFSGGRAAAASAAASTVRAAYPGLQIVAIGSLAEPESAIAALRAPPIINPVLPPMSALVAPIIVGTCANLPLA